MPTLPSSLDSGSLARRLGELAGDEREVQVEFLLHLDEFDRRRAYLEAGFGSLWEYCRDALHLREGAAGRRINAMRVLRRFPGLARAMRDGRLCLSTLGLLGQVLTVENVEELVARAAYRSTAEVDHLVASLRPRPAPREGIRRLPEPAGTGRLLPDPTISSPPEVPRRVPPEMAAAVGSPPEAPLPAPGLDGGPATSDHGRGPAASTEAPLLVQRPPPVEIRPVSEDRWSLRATIDRTFKDDLETLSMLLSHKVRKGNVAAVLHEAIRCAIEKHGKRKGAVRPARKVAPRKPPRDPAAVPAELRRKVWERDGGRCAWTGPDGRRCGSRWQLEVDHVDPAARGGKATLDRLRLLCRGHNVHHAEEIYGKELMKRYRKRVGEARRPRTGEFAIDNGGTRGTKAREESVVG